MCNRYGYQHPYRRLVDEFSDVGPVRWSGAEPNAPRDPIRPTDRAPILRPTQGSEPAAGLELVEVRWGLVPWFHKGAVKDWKMLGTNARCETAAATAMYREAFKRRRCLVPASRFFEWTGEKGAKIMWRFTVPSQPVFAFPGLWDRVETPEGPIESFTLLTKAAGPACAPYHNRQPVILRREDWAAWLDLDADVTGPLTADPGIAVERA